jgi:hypothetical protein
MQSSPAAGRHCRSAGGSAGRAARLVAVRGGRQVGRRLKRPVRRPVRTDQGRVLAISRAGGRGHAEPVRPGRKAPGRGARAVQQGAQPAQDFGIFGTEIVAEVRHGGSRSSPRVRRTVEDDEAHAARRGVLRAGARTGARRIGPGRTGTRCAFGAGRRLSRGRRSARGGRSRGPAHGGEADEGQDAQRPGGRGRRSSGHGVHGLSSGRPSPSLGHADRDCRCRRDCVAAGPTGGMLRRRSGTQHSARPLQSPSGRNT